MVARILLATAATIFLAHPTSAQAQSKSEFAVVLGSYLPTNQSSLGRGYVTTAVCIEAPEDPECRSLPPGRHENPGMAVGARWTGWLGKGAGIEGTFWWASGGSTGTTVLSSLRGVFRFAPDAQTSVVLLAGPVMVNRFDYADDMASFGGAVGIGLDVRPGRDFAFRLQVEDYLYSVQPTRGDGLFQQDFVLSLSVALFHP